MSGLAVDVSHQARADALARLRRSGLGRLAAAAPVTFLAVAATAADMAAYYALIVSGRATELNPIVAADPALAVVTRGLLVLWFIALARMAKRWPIGPRRIAAGVLAVAAVTGLVGFASTVGAIA